MVGVATAIGVLCLCSSAHQLQEIPPHRPLKSLLHTVTRRNIDITNRLAYNRIMNR